MLLANHDKLHAVESKFVPLGYLIPCHLLRDSFPRPIPINYHIHIRSSLSSRESSEESLDHRLQAAGDSSRHSNEAASTDFKPRRSRSRKARSILQKAKIWETVSEQEDQETDDVITMTAASHSTADDQQQLGKYRLSDGSDSFCDSIVAASTPASTATAAAADVSCRAASLSPRRDRPRSTSADSYHYRIK